MADRDLRRRAEAGKKVGIALERAAKALTEYMAACQACGETFNLDDDRRLTRDRCADLGSFLAGYWDSNAGVHGLEGGRQQ